MNNTGTISPGNSTIGTLSAGSYTFGNNSTYISDINSSGQSDNLSASNGVTINSGSTLNINPLSGNYIVGQTYTIVSAPSITGTFSNVTSTSNALSYQVKYYATHIDIVITSVGSPVVNPSSSVGSTAAVDPPSTGFGTPSKIGNFEDKIVVLSLLIIVFGSILIYKNKSIKI